MFIQVHSSGNKRIYYTIGAMLIGIIVGMLLKNVCAASTVEAIDFYGFSVFKTMFLNALKMMVAPIVFFSIAGSIGGISDVSDVGRMGAKIMLMYMVTTIFAIALGFGIAALVFQGDISIANLAEQTYSASGAEVSIRDTIIGIIPSNLVTPILEMQMLPIIFVAVLFGIAIGKIGEHVSMIVDFIEAMNKLCNTIITMLVRFVPIATFCAMASMMIHMGVETLLVLLRFLLGLALGWVGILIVYTVLLMLISRMSPVPFVKKNHDIFTNSVFSGEQ